MDNQDQPMTGKTCLVTGATAGIGKETALGLARQGATVVVVGRNWERCTATVEQIKAQTGNSSVDFLVADLSSLQEVRNLAGQVKER